MKLLDTLFQFLEEIRSQEDSIGIKKTVKNVIGFYGIKAGLGTSTIVANVASVLASNDYRVCVVDFDLHFPAQPRLLMKRSKLNKITSMKEFFTNSNIEITRIFNDTQYAKMKLVCADVGDNPNSFFELSIPKVQKLLEDISPKFDYVLVDLGGSDVGYETCTQGLKCCNQVFTVITPNADIIEGTYKIYKFFEAYNSFRGQITVIQNQIISDPLNDGMFKKLGMNRILDLPFYPEIAKLRYNDQIVVRSSIEGKLADIWRTGMIALASTIHAASDMNSYSHVEATELDDEEDTDWTTTQSEIANVFSSISEGTTEQMSQPQEPVQMPPVQPAVTVAAVPAAPVQKPAVTVAPPKIEEVQISTPQTPAVGVPSKVEIPGVQVGVKCPVKDPVTQAKAAPTPGVEYSGYAGKPRVTENPDPTGVSIKAAGVKDSATQSTDEPKNDGLFRGKSLLPESQSPTRTNDSVLSVIDLNGSGIDWDSMR